MKSTFCGIGLHGLARKGFIRFIGTLTITILLFKEVSAGDNSEPNLGMVLKASAKRLDKEGEYIVFLRLKYYTLYWTKNENATVSQGCIIFPTDDVTEIQRTNEILTITCAKGKTRKFEFIDPDKAILFHYNIKSILKIKQRKRLSAPEEKHTVYTSGCKLKVRSYNNVTKEWKLVGNDVVRLMVDIKYGSPNIVLAVGRKTVKRYLVCQDKLFPKGNYSWYLLDVYDLDNTALKLGLNIRFKEVGTDYHAFEKKFKAACKPLSVDAEERVMDNIKLRKYWRESAKKAKEKENKLTTITSPSTIGKHFAIAAVLLFLCIFLYAGCFHVPRKMKRKYANPRVYKMLRRKKKHKKKPEVVVEEEV